MASRRDELNAYTFARKRTVGAFLQPEGGGSDEDAPRPVRALVPSLVVGALVMAGFGLWGMIKPAAPQGWDSGKNVIVGKDSTTRYVLLSNPDGSKTLHPVVNMASAKLVLPADSAVVFVADSVLDHYKSHGATIGIPFAPDKLPTAADAAKPKTWSVCDRPGTDPGHPDQSVFLAADADAAALSSPAHVLTGGQNLYVQVKNDDGSTGPAYLVDQTDTSHRIGGPGDNVTALQGALFGNQAKPETVTAQWLATLHEGTPITFPVVPGLGQRQVRSSVPLSDPHQQVVGRLLITEQKDTYYVVGADRLYQVSAFQAQLIQLNPATQVAYDNADGSGPAPTIAQVTPKDLDALSGRLDRSTMGAPADWPTGPSGTPVNTGGQSVICSTFKGTYTPRIVNNQQVQVPDQTVWAGTDFPATVVTGANTAHVSPGHGLFYRAMDSSPDGSGSNFLITETGLRYSVPANSEGTAAGQSPAPASPPGQQPGQQPGQPQVNEAQARLGYKDDTPVNVPKPWSDLVPAGPALNTNAATQEQNS